ncbi:MAG: OmpH family outer membrane protein [Flavobacteriaceae bacterium]|jgi:outer membrane protein|nr:OmpH family outer membrane protein [Flavobacteriaceae bacterium]
MKKIITYIILLIFSLSFAQKIAYVDTQYILKQMPQYQQSEQRLNSEAKKWQEEIIKQQSTLEKLRVAFENEKILLTEDQQKTRVAVIDSTEKVLNDFIEKKFGTNGESISLRVNLVKPLQDQIWNAINTVATKDKYNIIFDKSSDLIMIFTDSKYDITDTVLKQLGMGGKDEKEASKSKSSRAKVSDSKAATSKTTPETKEAKIKKEEAKTTSEQPKSGYGSKYVPKKNRKTAETETETETKTELEE